jgi:acetyl-CoA carboxylase carboxyl transferase subunit beta
VLVIIRSVCGGESRNSSETESSSIRTHTGGADLTIKESSNDFNITQIKENSNDLDVTQKYKHLWVQCENCYGFNYKIILKSKMDICEQCGFHLKK